jgi:hypothetical protein
MKEIIKTAGWKPAALRAPPRHRQTVAMRETSRGLAALHSVVVRVAVIFCHQHPRAWIDLEGGTIGRPHICCAMGCHTNGLQWAGWIDAL